ncbi:hypothetical protein Tco_1043194 [Tanacetum coccineum]|uniref:Uncharacterized protein n=1 Tax=Tanacetum coccineum TaxID=301880 RepID=A0ABQ5GMA7_9ASTR
MWQVTWEMDDKMKKTRILTRLYGVTPMIVLRRKPIQGKYMSPRSNFGHSDIPYHVPQENHVPKVIAPNEPAIPLTQDTEGPPDLINTEGIHEQNIQNEQIITQPTEGPSWNNTEVLVSINESVVLDVPKAHISNQASTSSHLVPQDGLMPCKKN